jgi:hypothetical protein
VGGGPAKVDQITSVTVTDEPVADAPSPPDPNELVERAQALIGMGITDMVEIKELITGMHAEEARSRVIVIADTLVEFVKLCDATLLLATFHRHAQEAMLKRLAEVSVMQPRKNLQVSCWHIAIVPSPILRASTDNRPLPENCPPEPEAGTEADAPRTE